MCGGTDITIDDVFGEMVRLRFELRSTYLQEIGMEGKKNRTAPQDRFTLDEGPVVLTYPPDIGLDSLVEFEDWIKLVLGGIRRRATASLPTKGD